MTSASLDDGMLADARRLMFWYGLAAFLFICVLTGCLYACGDAVRLSLSHYIFPENWEFASQQFFQFIIKRQPADVLFNAFAGLFYFVGYFLLWPIRNRLSVAQQMVVRPVSGFPNEIRGLSAVLEELKLALLYFLVFSLIVVLGYYPDPVRRNSARLLSYIFLIWSISIDFLAPTFVRHGYRYDALIQLSLRRPMIFLKNGLSISWPFLIGGVLLSMTDVRHLHVLSLLLIASIATFFVLLLGGLLGTRYALGLIPVAIGQSRIHRALRRSIWSGVGVLSLLFMYHFFAIGQAFHHKSQILKCDYDLKLSSVRLHPPRGVNLPDLSSVSKNGRIGWINGLTRLMDVVWNKGIGFGISMDVNIDNPTAVDVVIEDSRVELRHENTLVAGGHLDPIGVRGHSSALEHIRLDSRLLLSSLRKGTGLLEDKWSLTLYVRLHRFFEFPIYLHVPE